jgi:hypothetical protein
MVRQDWLPSKHGKAIVSLAESGKNEEIVKKLGYGATKSGVRILCERFKEHRSAYNAKKSE